LIAAINVCRITRIDAEARTARLFASKQQVDEMRIL